MRGEQQSQTRVDGCVQWVRERISTSVFRAGARIPSIRTLARQRRISPFTVAEAYDRLVAEGELEARRGSGFYVRTRPVRAQAPPPRRTVDFAWLMSHMLQRHGARGPGLGVLPASWLDGARLGTQLRSLGRQHPDRWLHGGTLLGYAPLRMALQERLAQLDIVCDPEQIVLTTGVTQALDLVVRTLVRPGEAVLALDPCWFGTHGLLTSHRARVVPVPCGVRGPDLAALERLVQSERPRLMVMSSAGHNPTGVSLSREVVLRILEIARRGALEIFEDDVYADLCSTSVTRLAAADRLQRVIYSTSFSKTLAANVRVGMLACRPELARTLGEAKIVSGFTTPELNERLVHKLLVERHYARHVERLRARLAVCRDSMRRTLTKLGIDVWGAPQDGMFFWIDMRTDTTAMAAEWREKGLLLAPGSLFSPSQRPTTWMRFNVTTRLDASVLALLRSASGG